jgi:RNA polymerase sigma factor (sigma-70 family)
MEPTITIESGFIEELCRAYEAPLHHYLTQIVGSSEVAQELAQKSLEHLDRAYRPHQVIFPRAMLFRVATDFALMHLQRRRTEPRFWGDAIDMEYVEEELPDRRAMPVDRQVLADQIRHHLAVAIKELRPTLRCVFVMAHMQRTTRTEIAAELGVSEKRVDKRMTKALRACRERLSANGIELADVLGLVGLVQFACMLSVR